MFIFELLRFAEWCEQILKMNPNNLNYLLRILKRSKRLELKIVKNYCSVIVSHSQNPNLSLSRKIISARRPLPSQAFYSANQLFCSDSKNIFLENDPDTFGDRRMSRKPEDEIVDEGDIKEQKYIENPPNRNQRLTVTGYARLIKEQLSLGRLKEALDILEIKMKEDRVKPDNYIFKLLISACAKAGYTKKAFQLYNKMKQHDLKVTGGTYTSLFNACANSPWPKDGLERADHLREIMLQKMYEPNEKNYHAMMKAYGRCGDLKTAFLIADEMIEKKVKFNIESFNFLLQACASDKEFGFRHALLVWHKMYQQKLTPDLYSFNTMIRCVRDCEMGDIESIEQTLLEIFKMSGAVTEDKLAIPSGTDPLTENRDQKSLVYTSQVVDQTPNLISATPRLGSLLAISEIKSPEDRLLLLGGFSGFLEEMKNAKVTPGIETFTALLEVVPSTSAAEKSIVMMIRKIGLKADIDFFNTLIKKRSMRFDYEGAKKVILMIKTAKLRPDIVTYGVLALGCQTQEEARELLRSMQEQGVRMNIQILGAMLRQGCAHRNFAYIYEIMQIALEENIKPNDYFLRHLHNFDARCYNMIKEKHPLAKTRTFKHNHNNFVEKLKEWRQEYGIEDLKLEDAINKLRGNPYKQFKENQSDGFERTKNEALQRKQKPKKYIKKIKPHELEEGSDSHNKVPAQM